MLGGNAIAYFIRTFEELSVCVAWSSDIPVAAHRLECPHHFVATWCLERSTAGDFGNLKQPVCRELGQCLSYLNANIFVIVGQRMFIVVQMLQTSWTAMTINFLQLLGMLRSFMLFCDLTHNLWCKNATIINLLQKHSFEPPSFPTCRSFWITSIALEAVLN